MSSPADIIYAAIDSAMIGKDGKRLAREALDVLVREAAAQQEALRDLRKIADESAGVIAATWLIHWIDELAAGGGKVEFKRSHPFISQPPAGGGTCPTCKGEGVTKGCGGPDWRETGVSSCSTCLGTGAAGGGTG